ncbi:Gfo/Idh/MocA family protein [Tritonibacter horizontis]|uniref:Putative oxidoreductase YdgJ n=1 Tax=Tritonibacter horizontis TaxID=1768241 RepID=A0A132BYA6_9RHOB|nr:Gfo/Idh/MocA family oxidoreductase [Tritonibacter horizontis]KUP93365.1 putative oxidoreductase YdgJ [Tritonibacter horizontis]
MTGGSHRPPIRVACVGAGYFSRFHYDSWARMEGAIAVASCNRDITRAEATGLPAYNDLATMLEDVKPDLLDIILPPVAHADTIRTALAHGVTHMICQKPFCTDLDEARKITAEAEAAGAVIVVHENFRFQPWYRTIKSALNEGLLGTLQQVTFRLRPGDGQGPDAYLDRQPYFQEMERFLIHETAVHWVDTFRYLLGNPTGVYADLRQVNPVIQGEDAGFVLFDHPNGVRALFDGNRHLDHAADNLRRTMGEAWFEGTEGSLTLHGDGSVRLRHFGSAATTPLLAADTWDGFGGDCVHALQAHVISGLLGADPLENTVRDYLTVIEIEQAIYASSETGRKITLEQPAW